MTPPQPDWLVRLFHPDEPTPTRIVYTLRHPRVLCYRLRMASNKDINRLIRLLREQGFKVELKNNGHHEVRNEDGEFVTWLASTPSEYRGWQNALATLRRHGFLDPKRPHKKKDKDAEGEQPEA